jgi:hypothetical protein
MNVTTSSCVSDFDLNSKSLIGILSSTQNSVCDIQIVDIEDLTVEVISRTSDSTSNVTIDSWVPYTPSRIIDVVSQSRTIEIVSNNIIDVDDYSMVYVVENNSRYREVKIDRVKRANN